MDKKEKIYLITFFKLKSCLWQFQPVKFYKMEYHPRLIQGYPWSIGRFMPCHPSRCFLDKHSACAICDFRYVEKNTNASEASRRFVRENTRAVKMLQGISKTHLIVWMPIRGQWLDAEAVCHSSITELFSVRDSATKVRCLLRCISVKHRSLLYKYLCLTAGNASAAMTLLRGIKEPRLLSWADTYLWYWGTDWCKLVNATKLRELSFRNKEVIRFFKCSESKNEWLTQS